MKDALTIAVTDHKLRKEFRRQKGADNTLAKYEEASRLWVLIVQPRMPLTKIKQ